jgi:hypothetical protein
MDLAEPAALGHGHDREICLERLWLYNFDVANVFIVIVRLMVKQL